MGPPASTPLQSFLNYIYTTFFIIHLPLLLLIDCYPLYPQHLIPQFMTDIRTFYVTTYKDRFFTNEAPAWFWWFLVMEGVGHGGVCFAVLVNGGVGDSPTTHLNLLLFAAQTALTTGVCIAEYRSWPELSAVEKITLGQLYVPYFAFALVMLVDMYLRVRGHLLGATTGGKEEKERERQAGKKMMM